jgi:hypothetical protein
MRHSASKWPLLWAVGAAILISAPARAQEEPTQPNPTLRFKLDRRDGCFRYIGDACRIHRFKTGSYVGVSMITLGRPTTSSRDYSILFSPRAAWGSSVLSPSVAAFTPPS